LKIKSVLFNIDNTLYNASLQIENARLNAIRAMIEAGLPVDIENGYRILKKVVEEYGEDYPNHFNKLLEKMGLKWNPHVIAAGVVAFRETNLAFLKPYPDTIKTLLKLRESGYKLGVISDGRIIKQWQKLIQLRIQHFFDTVVISEEYECKKLTSKLFDVCLYAMNTKAEEAIFIGDDIETDIKSANESNVTSIRIRKGESRLIEPKTKRSKAKYEITKLSEIFELLDLINSSTSK